MVQFLRVSRKIRLQRRRWVVNDFEENGSYIFAIEGKRIRQQLIQHNPDGKDVGTRIDIGLVLDLLGRHIRDAAHQLTRACDVFVADTRDSKVNDLDGEIFKHHDIRRFNVTVNHVVLMSVTKCVADLNYDIQLLFEWDGSTRGDNRLQALTFQI